MGANNWGDGTDCRTTKRLPTKGFREILNPKWISVVALPSNENIVEPS